MPLLHSTETFGELKSSPMASPYRGIAENVVTEAAEENALPAVRAPIADVPEIEREIRAILAERSLTAEYDVEVRGDLVAVIPKETGA
jgi:hypothetical protein